MHIYIYITLPIVYVEQLFCIVWISYSHLCLVWEELVDLCFEYVYHKPANCQLRFRSRITYDCNKETSDVIIRSHKQLILIELDRMSAERQWFQHWQVAPVRQVVPLLCMSLQLLFKVIERTRLLPFTHVRPAILYVFSSRTVTVRERLVFV